MGFILSAAANIHYVEGFHLIDGGTRFTDEGFV